MEFESFINHIQDKMRKKEEARLAKKKANGTEQNSDHN